MKILRTISFVLVVAACGPAPVPPCPDAGTALTYGNFGSEFMRVYCVACHSGGRIEKNVDLSSKVSVAANAHGVITTSGTGTSMPESGPMPTAMERAQLTEWASCGAP